MKHKLDEKVEQAENLLKDTAKSMLKNIDNNTRLGSIKMMGKSPARGTHNLEMKDMRLCAKDHVVTDKDHQYSLEAKYRESLYQPSMGFCGVYAISYYTGIRFDIVFDYMRAKFNRGGTWAGGTQRHEVEKTLDHFGYEMKPVDVGTRTQVKNLELPEDRWYWIHIRRHWMLINNGYCVDQSETARQDQHWTKRKIVLDAWEVVEKQDDTGGA